MDSREALIGLNMVSTMGSVRLNRLIGRFGAPEKIFSAGINNLRSVGGVGEETARRIKNFDFSRCETEIKEAREKGINIITVYDEKYPPGLREIHDPPPVIYIAGRQIPKADLNIGIVGTRESDKYGLAATAKIIKEMAMTGFSFNIISGLARGIDTAAHIEALRNSFFTAAVLGFGLNKLYPFNKNPLIEKIYKDGCFLSEFPLNNTGAKQNFPRRNRCISGLSDGVLIIEAAERSGALITADCALEQGREVFALPGGIFSEKSKGTNELINQGAKILRGAADILSEFGLEAGKRRPKAAEEALPPEGLTEEEEKIFRLLEKTAVHIDEISIKSGIDVMKLNSILTFLELKGIVKQLGGKKFIKN